MRAHPEDFRCGLEQFQHGGQIVAGSSADLTQILGQNQIGLQFADQIFVHLVEAATTANPLSNRSINLAQAHFFKGDRWTNHDWFQLCFDRKIAFVRDSNQLIAEAQPVNHFSGGGQKRDNSSLVQCGFSKVSLTRETAARGIYPRADESGGFAGKKFP